MLKYEDWCSDGNTVQCIEMIILLVIIMICECECVCVCVSCVMCGVD